MLASFSLVLNNSLQGNKATHNSEDGFVLFEFSSNNNLGNKAKHNEGYGFLITELSHTNKLQGNIAANNQLDGFFLRILSIIL